VDRQRALDVCFDPDAFGGVQLTAVVDAFGTEAFDWSPVTLQLEMRSETGKTPPPAAFDRLMAAVSVVGTDLFTTSVDSFNRICLSLSGHSVPPDVWVPAGSEEIAWGLVEAAVLDPEEIKPGRFHPEIRGFIGQVSHAEGYIRLPDVLAIGVSPDAGKAKRAWASLDESARRVVTARERDLVDSVRKTLRAWVDQLESLPLRSGDSRAFRERLVSELDKNT